MMFYSFTTLPGLCIHNHGQEQCLEIKRKKNLPIKDNGIVSMRKTGNVAPQSQENYKRDFQNYF